MARPLRIEFPGAVYHVTSRGDRREPIFVDDADRLALLDVLGSGLDRFDACALAWNADVKDMSKSQGAGRACDRVGSDAQRHLVKVNVAGVLDRLVQVLRSVAALLVAVPDAPAE